MTLTRTVNGYEVKITNVPTDAKHYIIATDLRFIDDLTDEVKYVTSFDSKSKAYNELIRLNIKGEKQYYLHF